MRIHVVDHPLVAHKLTTLRDERTDSPTFRRLADELVTLLAYEATRDVRTDAGRDHHPGRATTGTRLSYPRPLVVPILRAGLGMLDGMTRLLPTAEVGFLGMVRNEETLEASTYATRMPDDLSGRQVYVLDPMLATGGTLVAAIRLLIERGATDVTAVVLLAAPEGVAVMEKELAGLPVTVVTAALDQRLNEQRLHRPGPRRRRRPAVRHRRLRLTVREGPAAARRLGRSQHFPAGGGRGLAARPGRWLRPSGSSAVYACPEVHVCRLRVSVFEAAPLSWEPRREGPPPMPAERRAVRRCRGPSCPLLRGVADLADREAALLQLVGDRLARPARGVAL